MLIPPWTSSGTVSTHTSSNDDNVFKSSENVLSDAEQNSDGNYES